MTVRKARKTHRCWWCQGVIEVGERYVEGVEFELHEPPRRWRAHTDCEAFLGTPTGRALLRDMEALDAYYLDGAVRGGFEER